MTRKIMKSVQEKAAAGKGSIKVVKAAYFDPPVIGTGYGVYTDEACTHAVDALWIGLEGPDYDIASNLALGTYYIKEFSAPDQYELDKNVYSVTLTQSSPEATVTSLEPTKEPSREYQSGKEIKLFPSCNWRWIRNIQRQGLHTVYGCVMDRS